MAPAPLENWLRSHPLISQCMVVGDRRPYIAALITLDLDGVSHWRRMNGRHPVPAELLVDDDGVEGDPAASGGRGEQAGLPPGVHPPLRHRPRGLHGGGGPSHAVDETAPGDGDA